MGFINYKYLVVYGWKGTKYEYEMIHVDYEVFETLEQAERWAEQFNFSEIFERIEHIPYGTIDFLKDYFLKKWNREEPEKEMTYIFMDYKRKEYQFVSDLNSLLYLLVNYELLIKAEGYYYGSENEEYRLIFNVNRSKGEEMCIEEGLEKVNYVILKDV